MSGVFTRPNPEPISRLLLEVYKTDEENFVPYTPNTGESNETEKNDDEKTDDENTESNLNEEEEDDGDLKGFKLHQGKILEIYYYGQFTEVSYEHDYTEMTNNGSIKIPVIKDLNRFYKGVRLCVKNMWVGEGDTYTVDDLPELLKGFIVDEKFSESGMSLTLNGMSKLLDKKYQFNFTQMKRSKILEEVIKTAGLTPHVDATGLLDEVIDYTNISKSGSDESEDGESISAGANIDSLVKKWGKGKKGVEKAKAIHEGLRDEVGIYYRKYYNFNYNSAEECLQHHQNPGLNCGDTAQLTVACMKSGGLNANIYFRCDHLHFFTVIEIGGTKYYSDLVWSEGAKSQRPWNETWQNNKCGTPYNR